MDDKSYWISFSVFPGIGPKKFSTLLKHFGTAESSWNADYHELEKVLGNSLAEKLCEFKRTFHVEVYIEKLRQKNVEVLTLQDDEYPHLLREVPNAPFVLYVKGNKKILNQVLIRKYCAIVGTRKITSYGRDVTEQITKELVSMGFTIVSGLAFGVDACAHKTTIDTRGKTIAVLGCGVDCCSPRENTYLYNEILESDGVIVSEIPISTAPTKGSFPSRNRIIAGLSQAVVVTEGAKNSGALYTASDALSLNRPVFAVPGPITSQLSKGPNSLIAKGAVLVTGTEDILRELTVNGEGLPVGKAGQIVNHRKIIVGDNKEEQMIIDLLVNESLHFDDLVRKTKMDSAKVGTLLSIMEVKGFIRATGGIFTSI